MWKWKWYHTWQYNIKERTLTIFAQINRLYSLKRIVFNTESDRPVWPDIPSAANNPVRFKVIYRLQHIQCVQYIVPDYGKNQYNTSSPNNPGLMWNQKWVPFGPNWEALAGLYRRKVSTSALAWATWDKIHIMNKENHGIKFCLPQMV